ncbi:hypothetical protein O6H91_07G045800 [Diphasiastrum complanatum]|uniref:Uncharacterized protein n=4 Tax=Diphasiastrum complanatum TaxID=34168 RepID=A0ACC2D4P9_DIPCM|nr:hypothetical protein O6H91_07G045800 [Diphasiastrum complanatum]KAJ7549213.1 hypothetical protein O6H91_07G045800 [Diphasiastrum complanatum]KAJ7549215.1 hypothetical protein O6H91_07G045800 [Diphasiastrum complanatum]KAJ7549217.1 hypothetical protein O6H91_07G045800 [Diphasiastrum complanatum]
MVHRAVHLTYCQNYMLRDSKLSQSNRISHKYFVLRKVRGMAFLGSGFDGENKKERSKFVEKGCHRKKLSILPLVFVIFYEVSGGPFGVEDSVQSGGPLLALLGFIVFPFLWSIPEALITAELGTTFPENGGYVIWISSAFGQFWGFQEGWWKWLSGVIDNALYPVLFLDYLKWVFPSVGGGLARLIFLLVITAVLTYVNYRGLTIVGYTAVLLGVFSLLPFLMLAILAIPRLEPKRWLAVDLSGVDWRIFLNTLFWNLNYWDSVSTLAGEVERPQEVFPKALSYAVLLVILSYLVPLLAGTGALNHKSSAWTDGYFAHVAMAIGGTWLKWWVEIAAAFSNAGMFEAEMSSDSFQLLGMGEKGMLPEIFAHRSIYGTPILGIICSVTGVLVLSWLRFQEIIEILNFLYCLGMLLEFAAFICLRMKQPNLVRPYKIPVSTMGAVLLCLPPCALIIIVMSIASLQTMFFSFLCSLVGFILYPALQYVKHKKWARFAECTDRSRQVDDQFPAVSGVSQQDAFEAEESLLPKA